MVNDGVGVVSVSGAVDASERPNRRRCLRAASCDVLVLIVPGGRRNRTRRVCLGATSGIGCDVIDGVVACDLVDGAIGNTCKMRGRVRI